MLQKSLKYIAQETFIVIISDEWSTKSSKEQHLFEISFFNIINVFSVPFGQFNAPLLNKSIHLKKYITQPNYYSTKRH